MSISRYFWSLFMQFGLFFYLCAVWGEWTFNPGAWSAAVRFSVVCFTAVLSMGCSVHRLLKDDRK